MREFKRDRRSGGRDFDNRGSGRFGRRGSGGRNFRGSRDRVQMHEVTCDKCGESCEVPFKPTEGKPVYCDDCFKKGNNSESKSDDLRTEFDKINKKLDKILTALEVD